MVIRWILPTLLLVACTQPTEYVRDNPNDPTGTNFELPSVSGLTFKRVDRHIRLDWSTSFDRYTIHIERSVNGGTFALRDTLRSIDTTWIDTSVAMPDSNIYQYRVFGRYQDRSTDTLTSLRITSHLNKRPISELERWRNYISIHPWWPIEREPTIVGGLQTFYMHTDSTMLSVRYPDGSTTHRGRQEAGTFPYVPEYLSRVFVLTQYSRGRAVDEWISPIFDVYYAINPTFDNSFSGRFLPDFPSVYLGSTQLFLQSTGPTSVRLYDPVARTQSAALTGITESIASVVGVGSEQILYSTQSGSVFIHTTSDNSRISVNVPGPASTIGSYSETGELVYLRRHDSEPNTGSIDRFNVTTQTLVASFPVSSTSVYRILDRPERNEIWIFDSGLQRINRTTGALIQEFDDTERIKHLIFQNGAAFASFRNQAPYVKRYDLENGQVTTSPMPVPHADLLYLSDGDHIVFRSPNQVKVYRISQARIVAVSPVYPDHQQNVFIPLDSSPQNAFHYVFELSPHLHVQFRWSNFFNSFNPIPHS